MTAAAFASHAPHLSQWGHGVHDGILVRPLLHLHGAEQDIPLVPRLRGHDGPCDAARLAPQLDVVEGCDPTERNARRHAHGSARLKGHSRNANWNARRNPAATAGAARSATWTGIASVSLSQAPAPPSLDDVRTTMCARGSLACTYWTYLSVYRSIPLCFAMAICCPTIYGERCYRI